MAKIFDVQDWLKNHPNRNNFDLTHKVHGSYKFGTLYPFMCKPVVPTDSFKIDTAISARFMPMPFPTQSNMRVIFHYFYVRTKNIWPNFENWIEGLEEHTPPYINKTKDFYKTGSLADHLDIPTSFYRPSSDIVNINATICPYGTVGEVTLPSYVDVANASMYHLSSCAYFGTSNLNSFKTASPQRPVPYVTLIHDSDISSAHIPFTICEYVQGREPVSPLTLNSIPKFFTLHKVFVNEYDDIDWIDNIIVLDSNNKVVCVIPISEISADSDHIYYKLTLNPDAVEHYNQALISAGSQASFPLHFVIDYHEQDVYDIQNMPCPIVFLCENYYSPVTGMQLEVADFNDINPYYNSTDNYGDDTIKVSALPFRAYESVYHAFYRQNSDVQPFVVNGQRVYNKYNTTTDDGADNTDYHLFQRNWELDAYTSCLKSPQQGPVPYVGITEISALGRMSVETPEGETAEVRLSDNGDGVEISNLHGDTQEARAYALRAASSGFTIPEFREANALQRFLEMNIRKGYKYVDFIQGHFGKAPKYSVMDMPEFIGGFSQRISVNDISNTNGVDTDTLGAIAGQARAIGGSKHGITHYFDDFGFVLGIMCIVPDNAYNCVLPKHFNLKEPLDMYFPEFSQLSYMPLTYEELCPVQSHYEHSSNSSKKLTDVFGYQRPNHDLVWYPDTVHGEFRNPLNGIGSAVICRNFAVRPELGNDFVTIKSSETDTIFNYTLGTNDICLGEIVVKISAKRPIPRLVVPSIS